MLFRIYKKYWRNVIMKFSEELLTHITANNLVNILEEIRNKHLGIWGIGQAGQLIYASLKKNDIICSYFIDSNPQNIGTECCGVPVCSKESMQKDDVIVVAANVKYGIHEQLKKRGIRFVYIDPISLLFYNKEDPYYVKNEIIRHQCEIDQVYSMLTDSVSKQVYYNTLLHRAIHDLSLIWAIYDENQYFGNRIIQTVSGNFVDCGAYQGDTLTQFMQQIEKRQYKYFAFEADKENYASLTELYKKNRWNVTAYNLGVWDREDCLYFENDVLSDAAVGGKIVKSPRDGIVMVEANSLDQVLKNQKIDFIKMDIEGAELKALEGARGIIERDRPQLAISAYHQLSHLWEVPLLINKMEPAYNLYFAHHMWNQADTVCYALIKK